MSKSRDLSKFGRTLISTDSSDTPLIIIGASGQTADLVQFKDSLGNIKASIKSGGQLYEPGTIVQVQNAVTPTSRYGIQAQDISAIPGLEINFTPIFSNSKILLRAMINSNAQHVSTYGFLKNNSAIISNTNTNSNGSIATMYPNSDVAGNMWNIYIEYMDTVTSTSTINYKAAACASWAGDTSRTLWINDRDSNDMRSISTLTIMEIAQ